MSYMAKVDKMKLQDAEACREAARQMGLAVESYYSNSHLAVRGSQLYFSVDLKTGDVRYETDYDAKKSLEALDRFHQEYEIAIAIRTAQEAGMSLIERNDLADGSVELLWNENPDAAAAALS